MNLNTKEQKNKVIKLPIEWPYRLFGNVVILCFIFLLAIIASMLKKDIINKKLDETTQILYELSGQFGFILDGIVVENISKTTTNDIEKVIDLDRGEIFLKINVADIKEKLETLPWVKSATVKRTFFPNILHISLQEKNVASMWQFEGEFYPIDEEGKVINTTYIPNSPIMLIVGKGAPENFENLLKVIKKDNEIFSRIIVANFISERRWNVILDDIEKGIVIKLPENDIEKTWDKLIKINKTRGIFKRKLTIIDLRLPDKVVVKLGKANPEDKKQLSNAKESRI